MPVLVRPVTTTFRHLAHAPLLVESQSPIPVSQLLPMERETNLLVFAAGLPCAYG